MTEIVAHLNGGPHDGLTVALRHMTFHVVAVTEDDVTHTYSARSASVHPASFLHRWGGKRVQTGDDWIRDLPGRLVPDEHRIFDHSSLPEPERIRSEMRVIPNDLVDTWHLLGFVTQKAVANLEDMATFDRRDLEWSGSPQPDGAYRIRVEVVTERRYDR